MVIVWPSLSAFAWLQAFDLAVCREDFVGL
jgi:hypothetical protein